jgi:tRNA pseudouridine32 synthase/23S rRNA pseudouridine746 synthase
MKIYNSQVGKHFSQRTSLGEVLLKISKLSEAQISDAAQKGAVWIQRNGKGKILRIRSLKEQVSPQDIVQLFFEPKVLSIPEVKKLECIYEDANYGVWIKPAGVVPQGSQTGDHASVLRYVELYRKKEVFLVHRLDRETTGIMLVAYHSKAAGLLSDLFLKNKIKKEYEAVVLGEMKVGTAQTIKASLDDKEAVTHFSVVDSNDQRSLLSVTIDTGRLHQIRRHLDHIGHPIMGDPKYGKGNKNKEGLKLIAKSLTFEDPFTKTLQHFKLPESLSI